MKAILSKINPLLTNNELSDLYPQPYNVLCNWGNNGKSLDENDHTRMLLSLLRYERPSAAKYKMPILYSFVKTLGIDVDLTDVCADNVRFSEPYKTNQGKSFLDGLIVKKRKFAIIIENKICGAVDQSEQIKRYILSMVEEENVPLEHVWVVYLTKDGMLHDGKPTKDSYNEEDADFNNYDIEDRLICVNYRYDIIPWMKDSVLPMVKHSEHLLASSIEVYVNYVETDILHCDELSRARAEMMKSKVLEKLGVTAKDPVQIYKELAACLSKVSNESESEDRDAVISFVADCMNQIVQPVCDEFAIATKHLFARKGVKVNVKTNQVRKGYLQVVPEGWEYSRNHHYSGVHYEWIPITAIDLLEKKEFALMIHIEGKNNNEAKNKFEQLYASDFKNDFDKLCKAGILKASQKHKTAIRALLTDTILNLIKKGTLEDELAPVYEKALKYYDVLSQYVTQS